MQTSTLMMMMDKQQLAAVSSFPEASSTWSPPQRLTQVTCRHPGTNHVVRVCNSKIVRTLGSDRLGQNLVPITLCVDFLERSTCSQGQQCPHLHVLGMSARGWPLIPTHVDGPCCPPGWTVPAYDVGLTRLMSIPSQFVYPTKGSTLYAEDYNEQGPQGRYRYIVCPEYSDRANGNRCPRGRDCLFIHTRETLRNLTHSDVHVNFTYQNVSEVEYATLPPGAMLEVADPNVRSRVSRVPSEHILRSAATERLCARLSQGQEPTQRRPLIHCAHYYLKKMCNLGPQCTFVHVITVDPEAAPGIPPELNTLIGLEEHMRGMPTSTQPKTGKVPSRMVDEVEMVDDGSTPSRLMAAPVPVDADPQDDTSSLATPGPSTMTPTTTVSSLTTPTTTYPTTTPTTTTASSVTQFRHDPYSFETVCVWLRST